MVVADHVRAEAEPVVRLAEALVDAPRMSCVIGFEWQSAV